MSKSEDRRAGTTGGAARASRRRIEEETRLSPWHRMLRAPWVWVIALVLIGSGLLVPLGNVVTGPRLEVGQIAPRDYLATRDVLVLDVEATEAVRATARGAVLPVYDWDPTLGRRLDDQFKRLFVRGRELQAALALETETQGEREEPQPGPGDPVEADDLTVESVRALLVQESQLELSGEQIDLLFEKKFSEELEDRVRVGLGSLLRGGVVDDKGLLLENRLQGVTLRDLQSGQERRKLDLYGYRGLPDEVSEYLNAEVRRWRNWQPGERQSVADLLLENLEPNVYLNRSETASRREAAATQAEQVFKQIREGQALVRKGDEVNAATVAALEELGGNRRQSAQLLPVLGYGAMLAAYSFLLLLGIRQERSRVVEPSTFGGLALLTLGVLISLELGQLVARAMGQSFERVPFGSERSYLYALPFAALALLVSLFYGRAIGLVSGIGFAIVAGRLVSPESWWSTLYALVGSLAAVYSLDRLKERSAVTRSGLLIGLCNSVAALSLGLLRDLPAQPFAVLAFDVACAFVGGLVVAAMASFAVPILEWLLAVTTDMKLIELSDTNLPLLRRLAFEAPGTFQHSLMVANLAKVGCEAIEANSVLAYTSGLYHDIGKTLRPQYFAENQVGENRHDKLSPSMSSLIVINHVKDGVELAVEQKLPEPLIDAIRQHHGTRKLAYFFNRAKERSEAESAEPLEDDYRYPGPRPQNKVMGVLMLADGIEAASRVLRNPTKARIRGLVEEILHDCLEDDQLDETDLTLQDLKAVTREFCRVLESTYHKRVEYPGFEFNKDREPLRVVESG